MGKSKRPDRRADALLNLGQAYHALGQRQMAMDSLKEALTLTEDPARTMRIKAALGAVSAFSKKDDRAEALLRESLETARNLGMRRRWQGILNDLGNLLAAQGRSGEAVKAYRECSENPRPRS